MTYVTLSYQLIETAQDDLDPSCKITAEPYLFVSKAATAKQVNSTYMIDCVSWIRSCILAEYFGLIFMDCVDK